MGLLDRKRQHRAIVLGIVTNPTTCGGNGIIPLTFTNVPDGIYTINYDGGSFPNIAVSASAATIAAPAGTYNHLQITVNGETSALGVNVVLTDPVITGTTDNKRWWANLFLRRGKCGFYLG